MERISSTSSALEHFVPRRSPGVVACHQQELIDPFAAFGLTASGVGHFLSCDRNRRTEDTSALLTTTARSALRIASDAHAGSLPDCGTTPSRAFPQFADDLVDAFDGERVLVPRCDAGSSDDASIRCAGSAPGRVSAALHHVDQIKHHAALGSHHEIEVTADQTSKSTTTTFWPDCASAAPSAAVVVLPTPPPCPTSLPGPSTSEFPFSYQSWSDRPSSPEPGPIDRTAVIFICSPFSPDLHRLAQNFGGHVIGRLVDAIDGQQFRLQLAAENARRRIAAKTGDGPPRAVSRR